MKIEKVLDIRFIIPPLLTIFFVFLFSPFYFIKLFNENVNESWFFGGTSIFALGFLISSLNEKFIAQRKLQDMYTETELNLFKETKTFDVWKNKIPDKISPENVYLLELMNWINLDKVDKENNGSVRDQVHKRWNMAMTNYNSFLALWLTFFVLVVGLAFGKLDFPNCYWVVLWLSLFILLLYLFQTNGKKVTDSVFAINRVLVSYVKKLDEKN